jgi:hypothetical protein
MFGVDLSVTQTLLCIDKFHSIVVTLRATLLKDGALTNPEEGFRSISSVTYVCQIFNLHLIFNNHFNNNNNNIDNKKMVKW